MKVDATQFIGNLSIAEAQRSGEKQADIPDKVGPFLCEWCNKPMLTATGRKMNDDGTAQIIGQCRGACGRVWSKPVMIRGSK